jgi:hypothetical protein
MAFEPVEESEVGKTVDEWVMVDDEGQDFHVGMIGERIDVGGKDTFVEKQNGSCEILLVGPADEDGRRRLGIHRSKA